MLYKYGWHEECTVNVFGALLTDKSQDNKIYIGGINVAWIIGSYVIL